MIPLLINPAAGGGRGERFAGSVADALREWGIAVLPRLTRSSDELFDFAAESADHREPLILVCGGDGTVRAAANALIHTPTTLAILPAGSGNDLARALNIPRNPHRVGELYRSLLSRPIEPFLMDMGEADGGVASDGHTLSGRADLSVTSCSNPALERSEGSSPGHPQGVSKGRYFCTVATFGVDSEVSRRVHEQKRGIAPSATYLWAGIRELLRYEPRRIRLTGDFGVLDREILLCATANTPNYGGWYRIAPDASLDDGRFHVCVVRATHWTNALQLLPRVVRGTHVGHPLFEILTTRELRLESETAGSLYADGEWLADSPARLKVVPKALRVLRP